MVHDDFQHKKVYKIIGMKENVYNKNANCVETFVES